MFVGCGEQALLVCLNRFKMGYGRRTVLPVRNGARARVPGVKRG